MKISIFPLFSYISFVGFWVPQKLLLKQVFFNEGRDINAEDTQQKLNQGELKETAELYIWIECIGITEHGHPIKISLFVQLHRVCFVPFGSWAKHSAWQKASGERTSQLLYKAASKSTSLGPLAMLNTVDLGYLLVLKRSLRSPCMMIWRHGQGLHTFMTSDTIFVAGKLCGIFMVTAEFILHWYHFANFAFFVALKYGEKYCISYIIWHNLGFKIIRTLMKVDC